MLAPPRWLTRWRLRSRSCCFVVAAFACGTPVVAYAKGAVVELVRPGVNGFLAGDTADAVAALGNIAAIDRAACRADAEARFSAPRMAADYLAVYRRLLGASER